MEEARYDRGDRQGDLGRDLAEKKGPASISPGLPGGIGAGGAAVGSSSEIREERPVPRAALSLEISRLVSRVLSGETLDTAASGDELALRFPDAGMTGDMIAQAIDNAAGMVGMIREGGAPETPKTAAGGDQKVSLVDDESFAAALNAELGELTGDPVAEETSPLDGNGAPLTDADQVEGSREKTGTGLGAVIARGAAAAVRRAFFRG